jgi:collagen type VII alpha
MAPKSEVLFIDPAVSDIEIIVAGLRPDVDAVLLESGRAAVHVIAHGAPGQVHFSAGHWSAATLAHDSGDLAAIGHALSADGELRLWCCASAQGDAGEAFLEALSNAAGVDVCGATGRVGAAVLGGAWELSARASRPSPQPPLTAAGVEIYAGVLALTLTAETNVSLTGSPNVTNTLANQIYYIGASCKIRDRIDFVDFRGV